MLRTFTTIKYLEPKSNWNQFKLRGLRACGLTYSIFDSAFIIKVKIYWFDKFQKFKPLKFNYFYNDIQCYIQISKHEHAANLK